MEHRGYESEYSFNFLYAKKIVAKSAEIVNLSFETSWTPLRLQTDREELQARHCINCNVVFILIGRVNKKMKTRGKSIFFLVFSYLRHENQAESGGAAEYYEYRQHNEHGILFVS